MWSFEKYLESNTRSALVNESLTNLYLFLLPWKSFISLLISLKISSAGLPCTINLTPLPIKGINTFSWLPAYNLLSIINNVSTRPKPAETAWQPYFQKQNILSAAIAKWPSYKSF